MIFNSVVPIVKNVIENVTDLFDLNLDTISGSIEAVSNQGGGSEGNGNISVIENDVSLGEFDVDLDFDEVKYTSDFILSGFTDEVTFYDSASERITMDKELTPLQVTFPSGYIQSLKYNSVIKYDSKTVYLYDWIDGFNFPLIDYTDDGSSATLKMYAIYTESGKCEMVLLDRVMTDADLPTDFTAFLYIKDVTIPTHTLFQRSLTSILDYNNPNFYTRGSVTISDGIASGFTSSSYLDSNINIPLSSASSFEIVVSMNLTNSYSNYAIIGNEADHPRSGGFVLRTTGSNRVYFWSTSNKSDWNISNYWDTWIDTRDGMNYIKIVFTGSRYIFYYSTDGSTWEEKNGFDSTTPLADFYPRFGASANDIPLQGSLYLNETYFKINDEIAWVAYPTTYKWYCKEIKYDTTYTDKLPVNIWFNKAFYTQGGKYIESKNSYIIDYESDNENGCLIDYTDDGFGDLALHLYAIEFNDDDNYQLFLSDKTAVQLESYGDISDVEYIDDVVLQSHFNCEYSAQASNPNFTELTTATVVDEVLTGGTINMIPGYLNTNGLPWKFRTHLKTPSILDAELCPFGMSEDQTGIRVGRFSNGYWQFLASSGSGWVDTSNFYGSHTILTDTDYDLEFGWTGSTYYLDYSIDNWETIVHDISYNSSTPVGNGYVLNISGDDFELDLSKTYLEINSEIAWKPYTPQYTLKDQFQSFTYLDKDDEPSRFLVLSNDDLGIGVLTESANFTKSGSVNITDKVASGFTSSNYIIPNYTLAPSTSPWKIKCKFKPTSVSGYYTLIGSYYPSNQFENILLRINNGYMMFYISSQGGSWDISQNTGTYQLSANTTYEMEAGFDGTYYYTKFRPENSINWVDDLYFHYNYNYIGAGKFILGAHSYSGGSDTPFAGNIYLDECSVEINDYTIWKPYTLDKKQKFDIVGSPTIVDKVASGFTKSNYLISNIQDINAPFDVYIKFTTPSSLVSGGAKIFAIGDFKASAPNNEYKNVELFINRSGTAMYAKTSNNGMTSNVLDTSANNGATQIYANTTYYVKIGCDGTNTYAYYSTVDFDDNNMTLMGQVAAATAFPSTTVYIGYEPLIAPTDSYGKNAFGGTIDLNELYVKMNDDVIWAPYFTSSVKKQNFEIQGNVVITNGIAEGFSSSNYLYTNDFNFSDATNTYEVVFKVMCSDDSTGMLWHQPYGNSYFGTRQEVGRAYCYTLSGNGYGSYSDLTTYDTFADYNQWFYIKYTKNDSRYTLYTSTDNINWTYRTYFDWGGTLENDGHAFTIGYSETLGAPFPGKVDLNECYVKFDDEIVWTPYASNSVEIFENVELAPYSRVSTPYEVEDFTIIGSPILTNRVVSNFSFYNYIKLNTTAFRPQSDIWEIGGEITTGNDISTEQYFQGCCSNSDYKVPLIGVYQNKFRVLLSSSGSSWDICERTFGNDIATNTTYKFKLVFDGSSYELFVKGPSDADFISYGYETTSAEIYDNTLYNISLGSNDYNSNQYFRGTINLNEWYYIVNDSIVWQPYKTEYNIETKGCLVNYADDGSANTIKAYKVEYNDDSVYVVLTNDTDFTVTDMKSKTYLADIVIPEHETYHYGERDFVIDYENPDLSSGGTMGGTEEACQSDSYENSSYYPWYAFNRNSGNQWRSQSVAGNHWITFYTPTSILLDRIDIKNFSDGNYTTFQYKVLVSNDNETWTELKSDVNLNNTGNDVWSISGFTNNTAVKYIRILSTKGFNANQVGFNKIYIYGHYITTGYGWILDDE